MTNETLKCYSCKRGLAGVPHPVSSSLSNVGLYCNHDYTDDIQLQLHVRIHDRIVYSPCYAKFWTYAFSGIFCYIQLLWTQRLSEVADGSDSVYSTFAHRHYSRRGCCFLSVSFIFCHFVANPPQRIYKRPRVMNGTWSSCSPSRESPSVRTDSAS